MTVHLVIYNLWTITPRLPKDRTTTGEATWILRPVVYGLWDIDWVGDRAHIHAPRAPIQAWLTHAYSSILTEAPTSSQSRDFAFEAFRMIQEMPIVNIGDMDATSPFL